MDSLFYDGFENGRMNPENNDNRPTYGEEEEIIFKCHTLTDDIQCERTTNVENEGWQNAMGFEIRRPFTNGFPAGHYRAWTIL